jgi:hypothetical protein
VLRVSRQCRRKAPRSWRSRTSAATTSSKCLAWDANGGAVNEWKIRSQASSAAGVRRSAQRAEYSSRQFRVEEFRVPLMRGVLSPPSDAVVAASEFPLDLAVQHLSGGGASSLPVTLRTQIRQRYGVAFEGYDDFAFAQGGVTEGVRRRSFGEAEPYWKTAWLWAEDGSLGAVWREPKDAGASGPVATQELKRRRRHHAAMSAGCRAPIVRSTCRPNSVPRSQRRGADEFAHGADLAGVARRRAARAGLRQAR